MIVTRRPYAIEVVCPFCNSGPDEACRRTEGNTRPYHQERYDNARRLRTEVTA